MNRNYLPYADPSESDMDRAEMAKEDRIARSRALRLSRHPDCRDPNHPGCPGCEPDAFEHQQGSAA